MTKKYWQFLIFVLIVIVTGFAIAYRNRYVFNNYFNEVAVTKCVTSGVSFNETSSSVNYLYKVNGYVYQGSYSIYYEDMIESEKGTYFCIYSKKDVKVNAFIPVKTIEEVRKIKNDSSRLKKYLDRSQKARYFSRNNKH